MRPRNDSVLMALETYLRDVAVELGADHAVAAQDAKDVVDLETEVAKITVPKEEKRDFFKQYNPTTLAEFAKNYSYVDFASALRKVFCTANIYLEDDQEIIVQFPSYYKKLQDVLNHSDKRTLMNSFGFKFAAAKINSLSEKFRKLRYGLMEALSGKKGIEPRWKTCLQVVVGAFPVGVSKAYTRQRFSNDSKAYVTSMVKDIATSFKEILLEANWMGNKTKAKALEKLEAMTFIVGHPDVRFSDQEINEKYLQFVMTSDNFYKNMETTVRNVRIMKLQKLKEPRDDTEHAAKKSHEVNAIYIWRQNQVAIFAGMMQPPYFSETFPDSMNYGGIGFMIGHEITHGFDDIGGQYAKNGKLDEWWQPEDWSTFKDRRQCIIDQYGNYFYKTAEKNLNGINTQGENVADNGGLKESYRAYKKLLKRKGTGKLLPGLNLTQDQLFFLSAAQIWCGKQTKESAILQVDSQDHSPGRFRIIGPLQNSPDFAKAYNCPAGSPMNPEKKCSVW
ncbi:endothelin-converting enzyme 1 [Plakobranchus ocellatus]|uniref:Endothelin-converting enzyme 1 n=1 Tax=Plakobranchus ocellatus TaxID=259542 RepID=A0AAV4BJM4_9GAST|nr:endothelin-converting enzyme 1 [Plakobranchus ocellatus]